ncbi:hypothetical protein MMC25_000558 [Agyrium rufum]|nr:hypothetical protein [Agyrium rufum]
MGHRSPQPILRILSQTRKYSSLSSSIPDSIPAAKRKYVPTSGTYPQGFLVAGTHVGVKASNTSNPDLALITSAIPSSAAAVFTKNKFQAAPVVVSRDAINRSHGSNIRSIIINSGCANAVTGKGGMEDAKAMVSMTDACVTHFGDQDPQKEKKKSSLSSTLVMSTGVIGARLPIDKILAGIPVAHQLLSSSHESWLTAARAICTTDTFPKLISRTFTLPSTPDRTYSVAGMTKGAGMIHPNMATLLGIMCTDAAIAPPALKSMLKHAVDRSFNAISVDGDMSTNDTLAILANGAAGGVPITDTDSADGKAMQEVLMNFARDLSHLVVRDGEGATKFIRVNVVNALSFDAAKIIASTIARSPLVKTALFGKDANWGRILCAIGYAEHVSKGAVIPEQTSVSFVPVDGGAELKLLVKGEPESVDEARAKEILQEEDLEIRVDLGTGLEEASYWFCDFSYEYVRINGDYRT